MNHPKLSIIIVTFNSSEYIKDCLSSIYDYLQDKVSLEIIVVDNNSQDNTCSKVKSNFPNVRLKENDENLGFSKAANQGFRRSKGKTILLLNPDTELIDDSVIKMINYLEAHPKVGAGSGLQLLPDGETIPTFFQNPLNFKTLISETQNSLIHKVFSNCTDRHKVPSKRTYVASLSGGYLFLKRKALQEVGLFDRRFYMYMEDTDLCKRLREAGWNLVFDPEVKCLHHWRGSTGKNFETMYFHHHLSFFKYFNKHFGNHKFSNILLAYLLTLHYICWWSYNTISSESLS